MFPKVIFLCRNGYRASKVINSKRRQEVVENQKIMVPKRMLTDLVSGTITLVVNSIFNARHTIAVAFYNTQLNYEKYSVKK